MDWFLYDRDIRQEIIILVYIWIFYTNVILGHIWATMKRSIRQLTQKNIVVQSKNFAVSVFLKSSYIFETFTYVLKIKSKSCGESVFVLFKKRQLEIVTDPENSWDRFLISKIGTKIFKKFF